MSAMDTYPETWREVPEAASATDPDDNETTALDQSVGLPGTPLLADQDNSQLSDNPRNDRRGDDVAQDTDSLQVEEVDADDGPEAGSHDNNSEAPPGGSDGPGKRYGGEVPGDDGDPEDGDDRLARLFQEATIPPGDPEAELRAVDNLVHQQVAVEEITRPYALRLHARIPDPDTGKYLIPGVLRSTSGHVVWADPPLIRDGGARHLFSYDVAYTPGKGQNTMTKATITELDRPRRDYEARRNTLELSFSGATVTDAKLWFQSRSSFERLTEYLQNERDASSLATLLNWAYDQEIFANYSSNQVSFHLRDDMALSLNDCVTFRYNQRDDVFRAESDSQIYRRHYGGIEMSPTVFNSMVEDVMKGIPKALFR